MTTTQPTASVVDELMRGAPAATWPVPASNCTEASWQTHVLGIARFYGWRSFHVYNSQRSAPGFPDLILAKAGRPLVAAELKTAKGRVRPEQREWLALLSLTGVQSFLWRPADIHDVARVLGPNGPTL